MAIPHKPQLYRNVIDALVRGCRESQGQVGAERARRGLWNPNVNETAPGEEHEANLLLTRLTSDEREVIARMLAGEVETGVFETLKALEQHKIPPFEDGYEGSPCHDFIGRLSGDWDWPEDAS
jgi:hypothetical protein